jgi:hypothetical protein
VFLDVLLILTALLEAPVPIVAAKLDAALTFNVWDTNVRMEVALHHAKIVLIVPLVLVVPMDSVLLDVTNKLLALPQQPVMVFSVFQDVPQIMTASTELSAVLDSANWVAEETLIVLRELSVVTLSAKSVVLPPWIVLSQDKHVLMDSVDSLVAVPTLTVLPTLSAVTNSVFLDAEMILTVLVLPLVLLVLDLSANSNLLNAEMVLIAHHCPLVLLMVSVLLVVTPTAIVSPDLFAETKSVCQVVIPLLIVLNLLNVLEDSVPSDAHVMLTV